MSRITGHCSRCGRTISYTAPRPGEEPKEVRHMTEPGQPESCPK
ncbi:hypothetical protein [Streptomyces sp. NPDC060322]